MGSGAGVTATVGVGFGVGAAVTGCAAIGVGGVAGVAVAGAGAATVAAERLDRISFSNARALFSNSALLPTAGEEAVVVEGVGGTVTAGVVVAGAVAGVVAIGVAAIGVAGMGVGVVLGTVTAGAGTAVTTGAGVGTAAGLGVADGVWPSNCRTFFSSSGVKVELGMAAFGSTVLTTALVAVPPDGCAINSRRRCCISGVILGLTTGTTGTALVWEVLLVAAGSTLVFRKISSA